LARFVLSDARMHAWLKQLDQWTRSRPWSRHVVERAREITQTIAQATNHRSGSAGRTIRAIRTRAVSLVDRATARADELIARVHRLATTVERWFSRWLVAAGGGRHAKRAARSTSSAMTKPRLRRRCVVLMPDASEIAESELAALAVETATPPTVAGAAPSAADRAPSVGDCVTLTVEDATRGGADEHTPAALKVMPVAEEALSTVASAAATGVDENFSVETIASPSADGRPAPMAAAVLASAHGRGQGLAMGVEGVGVIHAAGELGAARVDDERSPALFGYFFVQYLFAYVLAGCSRQKELFGKLFCKIVTGARWAAVRIGQKSVGIVGSARALASSLLALILHRHPPVLPPSSHDRLVATESNADLQPAKTAGGRSQKTRKRESKRVAVPVDDKAPGKAKRRRPPPLGDRASQARSA
jgi:hypothetical protein